MVQFKAAFALAALFASAARAVTPVVSDGSDFVDSITGQRFQIIGVAYQPGGSSGYDPSSGVDALSDGKVCMRDAILLQRLGANAIRVYNLNPALDHTACASIFNAAGIYMILDVNSPLPNQSINRAAPWESYNTDYMTRVFQIIEAFKSYNNTLGFFVANEVINEESVVEAPQYVRAVTRDVKAYIKKHASRDFTVGYSAADVRPLLVDSYTYFTCNIDSEPNSEIDFFGINSYSWCGEATFESSQYNVIVADFSNGTCPVFFSEYGCNNVSPREFSEVTTLYGPEMIGTMSGGIIYEYSEEVNNYGLVNIDSNGAIDILEDYDNLRTQFDKIDLKALTASNGTATSRTPPTCDSSLITSNITSNFTLPPRPSEINDLINNGVGGKWPTGTTKVTDTAEPADVYGNNSQPITGLTLNILADDQSNLPGNNTSGHSGTVSGGNGSTGGKKNDGGRAHGSGLGVALVSALSLGLFAFLL